jgi:hypothetical protein
MAKKKSDPPIVDEPLTRYCSSDELNATVIWELFKETDERFKETDEKFKETDEMFKETREELRQLSEETREELRKLSEESKREMSELRQWSREQNLERSKAIEKSAREWEEIKKELGGIGKSNGEIAEDFFYDTLSATMNVAGMQFDYIDRNLHRKRNNLEAEYDIILYNNYKVLVVEVKYNFRNYGLRNFYKEKLKKFRSLFPDYKAYKIYGAIAAFTFEKGVKETAGEYGFYIFSQKNEKFRILNEADFQPNEIR